jgi:RNA polymerase sigma factor (sigma-70 family)
MNWKGASRFERGAPFPFLRLGDRTQDLNTALFGNSKEARAEYQVMYPSTTTTDRDEVEVGHLRKPVSSAAGFSAAYRCYGASVYRYAASRLGLDGAEDVPAEVFAIAWRVRAKYSSKAGTVQSWLLGITFNVIARHREAEQRWTRMSQDAAAQTTVDRSVSPDLDDVDGRLDATRRRARISSALAQLPRRERDPLLMHIMTGTSYDDISDALGVPVGTVRSRISRGRNRIKQQLEQGAD